jgi:hypothetical protein
MTAPLFLVNRSIDGIFLIDMLLQFRLQFEKSGESMTQGATWVIRPWPIAINYLKGWFAIDLLSVAVSAFDFLTVTGDDGSTFEDFKILRVLRVLRLVKLVRLLRASRMLKRWETRTSQSTTPPHTAHTSHTYHRWETHFSINYALPTLPTHHILTIGGRRTSQSTTPSSR